MTEIMCIADFETKFGTNQTRLELIDQLKNYINILKENFSNFRIVVYGSFIGCKLEPSDIDIMLTIKATCKDKGFSKIPDVAKSVGLVDVFLIEGSADFRTSSKPLSSAGDMIKNFNGKKSHVDKGINCSFGIEIT